MYTMFLASVYVYRCPFIIIIWLGKWKSACNLRGALQNKQNSKYVTEKEENIRFGI